jgi:hypothetical protein
VRAGKFLGHPPPGFRTCVAAAPKCLETILAKVAIDFLAFMIARRYHP